MSNKIPSQKELEGLVDGLFERLIEFREDLHRYPELSWREFRTTGKIKEIFNEHGIHNFISPLETGGIVDLVFDSRAPYILLRADIDALSLQDEKSVPYRSKNAGICHACGHDVHTAIVVGAALALHQLQIPLPYNLRFVFQPAEEPIPSGAPKMIKKNVLNNVKYALGLHMEPKLRLGTIGMTDGLVNMQSIRLDLTFIGKGGHSARPYATADLIWVASRVIQDSYQMVYREIDLRDSPVILTFTEIQASQGYNVIPGDLRLTATLRLCDDGKKDCFLSKFQQLLNYLAIENACQIKLKVLEGAPAIYNDPPLMAMLKQNIQREFWMPLKINTDFRTPGADDFSHYSKRAPGAMIRFGIKTKKNTASLHNGLFDTPKEAIKIAIAFFLHQIVHFE